MNAPVLYQETRISTAPTSLPSVLCINAGANGASSSLKSGRKRAYEEISGLDEETYARKHLATEASVFFRPKSRAPRNFLWRILDNRHLLEIQSVDLIYDQRNATADSYLTFQIAFPTPICPNGVALADAAEKDALEIFVVTGSQELCTITLKRDLLTRQTVPADFDSGTCLKKFASSSFSYKHPYHLVAISSLELFVSFHDGSMLQLEREPNATGAQWRETHFSEGGWSGTLKRSFPFAKPQTARYGDIDVHSDAIAAIAKSPDGEYIWTVGLDHKLKAWSTKSGNVDLATDLLRDVLEDEDRKRTGKYMMDAEQGALLQIVSPHIHNSGSAMITSSDNHQYYLVLHSPKDHQFKFYAVRHKHTSVEGDTIGLDDVVPGEKLVPPIDDLMDTNMWHMEHFAVRPGPHWADSQLWLRARSGTISKTFLLNFDLRDNENDGHDISALFRTSWTQVDTSYLSIDDLKTSVDFLGLDSNADFQAGLSERWLDFLFYADRFSEVSLETALSMYCKGRNLSSLSGKNLQKIDQPLKGRIVDAVSAKIILHRTGDHQPDYDRYRSQLHTEWETLFSLLLHLHSRRQETIGFSFDHQTGLPWSVLADYVAPIRASSAFELLSLNADLLIAGDISTVDNAIQSKIFTSDEDAVSSQIIAVARQLRRYFSASSQARLRDFAVLASLDQSSELSGEDSLQAIYDQCQFQDEIRDSDYDLLTETADEFNGLGSLTDDNIMMVLERLEDQLDLGAELRERPGRFGERLAINIARETLQLSQATLLDLLALVVFMHGDLEQDELSKDFRPVEMYDAIMLALRHAELRLWLVSNVRQERSKPNGPIDAPRSLYECLFWQDWHPKRNRHNSDLPHLLTAWNKAWTFGLALSQQWEGITTHILADLLKHEEIALAQDFSKFLIDSWWTSYLKGRLHIATGDYTRAALAFQDAAQDCGRTSAPPNVLLSAEELNYFNAGSGPYYQHIASLFEKLKEYSYTVKFAALALENFRGDNELQDALRQIDERKQSKDSPAKVKVNNAMNELGLLREQKTKEDVRIRLFNALVQTGQFESAYEILTDIKDPALQHSNLQSLIQICVKQDAIATLLELPISGDFLQAADTILLEMAKKSMKLGLPSGPPYHQILFAFRTQCSNFRGAAAILHEHLEHLRHRDRAIIPDPDDDSLLHIYVLLINTLACCGPDDAWLLADPIPGVHNPGRKRALVTLQDIRREYVAELDRRSEIVQGRFPVLPGAPDEDGNVQMF